MNFVFRLLMITMGSNLKRTFSLMTVKTVGLIKTAAEIDASTSSSFQETMVLSNTWPTHRFPELIITPSIFFTTEIRSLTSDI